MRLGRDISTDPGLQAAESLRYSSLHITHLALLPNGEWCLYDYTRKPIYIGPLDGVPEAYATRAMFVRHEPVTVSKKLADLDLDIDL